MPAILEILALFAPAILAFSGKIIKGKKRYVIAIAAYFILKKMATEAARQKSLSEIQSGSMNQTTSNALAGLYKLALNPSGIELLMSSDGTDEELLYELASKTTNYKGVYDAYQIQFKRDLTQDLQSELSTTEYKRFIDILQ